MTDIPGETVIEMSDTDPYAIVTAGQPSLAERLRRNPHAEEIEPGVFRVPVKLVNIRSRPRHQR